MRDIRLWNTRDREKQSLTPGPDGRIGMYVCGPTVYDRAHIGNARPVVVFDVLYRLLRHVHGADNVTYVRNFTDVDDKIIKRADESGRPIDAITAETTQWYLDDMAALGAREPDHMPRATDYVNNPDQPTDMVRLIETLIDRGHAYAAEGHVLFAVESWSDYGSLSHRSTDDMIAGARVDVAPYKRGPMDFVLWKPSTPEQPGWDSPWGRGRPGWHIECSAMAKSLLGDRFQIHGGGIDLAFPHHENERAQSCCANGTADIADIWMHNGFLMVEGEKMSKSLGNFFTVHDLLERGIPGEVIRYVLLSSHYRQPIDWTEDRVEEAIAALRKFSTLADIKTSEYIDDAVLGVLSDDLNTPEAIALLHDLYKNDDRAALKGSMEILGFDIVSISEGDWAKPFHYTAPDGTEMLEGVNYHPTVGVMGWGSIPDELRDLSVKVVHRWLALRRTRDWSAADDLRAAAARYGVELRATRSPNGINGGIAKLRGSPKSANLKVLLR